MVRRIILSLVIILITTMSVNAESLFRLTASQGYTATPKSLYAGVRACAIGDTVSIVISETITSSDNINFSTSKTSETVDRFTEFIRKVLHLGFVKDVNNFGGSNAVENTASTSRTANYSNTITAQVVQVQANGNLIVQGKKSVVNGNERVDLIVSGVVDPRWINDEGQIDSSKVGNLQFGISGRGSISRSQNEGIINRFIRYLF
ncbi:flagellar basal body L-ring protein FlgH [bacterium]|nr:flagellar basal body L-ring protein FlgH [bacterium]